VLILLLAVVASSTLRTVQSVRAISLFLSPRQWRSDARTALDTIRKVVEANAPPGSVPDEIVDRGLVKEAEALIEGGSREIERPIGVATPYISCNLKVSYRLRVAPVRLLRHTNPAALAVREGLHLQPSEHGGLQPFGILRSARYGVRQDDLR
jgi:hypothetical protein